MDGPNESDGPAGQIERTESGRDGETRRAEPDNDSGRGEAVGGRGGDDANDRVTGAPGNRTGRPRHRRGRRRSSGRTGADRSGQDGRTGGGPPPRPGNDQATETSVKAATPRGNRRKPRRQEAEAAAFGQTYAALDLGTNNCRLLVARPTRRSFHVVDAFSRIIRLGEGIGQNGRLSDAAMSRTITALRVCADKLIRHDVQRSRLIATQACRIAENGEEFIARVKHETGLELEVVDRETEAKLAVSGCASLLDRTCDWALVFDIGGGSSELIWLDLTLSRGKSRRTIHDRVDIQDSIAAWTSLPVGVVTLAEKFGGQFVDAQIYEDMVQHVQALLVPFEDKHRIAERTRDAARHFLGTSGTVTTIAGIQLKLPRYDRKRVDGCWLSADQVHSVIQDLAAMDYQGRVAQPCIGRERADLVLAGCAILEGLMRTWPCERLRVADRGLREGILAMLMAEDGIERGGRRRERAHQ